MREASESESKVVDVMAWALRCEEDPVAWAVAEVPSECCRLAMVVVLRGCDELNTKVIDHPRSADYI